MSLTPFSGVGRHWRVLSKTKSHPFDEEINSFDSVADSSLGWRTFEGASHDLLSALLAN